MKLKHVVGSIPVIAAALGLCAAAASGDGCVPAPTDVYATDNFDCSLVEVGWTPNGGEFFRVMRAVDWSPGSIEEVRLAWSSPIYDDTATFGVTYHYWVIAVDPCGESQPSASDDGGRGLGGNAPPAWVSATDNAYCDLIVVDWDTGGGGSSFDVYRSETPDFDTAALVANTYPPLYDYSVAGNVGYYYWVVANSDCGSSPPGGPDVGYSNFGLHITDNPSDQYVNEGDSAGFSIGVSGFGAYQWFRDGEQLSDGGNISGANEPTLSINPASLSDVGDYWCEVYGGCGSQTSGSAHLYVEGTTPCPADFNQDGGIDGSDVDAFFGAWESGDASADVNLDGGIDGGDVETFFAYWEAGGC